VSSLLPAFWVVLELSRRWFRVRVWSSNRVLAGSGRVLARTRACRRGRARLPGLLWSPVLRPSWGRLTAGKASCRRGGAPGAYSRRGGAPSRPVGDGQGWPPPPEAFLAGGAGRQRRFRGSGVRGFGEAGRGPRGRPPACRRAVGATALPRAGAVQSRGGLICKEKER